MPKYWVDVTITMCVVQGPKVRFRVVVGVRGAGNAPLRWTTTGPKGPETDLPLKTFNITFNTLGFSDYV
jgi:hypothetical protein